MKWLIAKFWWAAGLVFEVYRRKGCRRNCILKRLPKGGDGIEIGVWKGAFSKRLLKATKAESLTLIDPWIYGNGEGTSTLVVDGQKDMDKLYRSVQRWASKHRNVYVMRDFSFKASTSLYHEGSKFDWVYIDGDHSAYGCYDDLCNFWPLIKSGGMVAGDDFGMLKGDPVGWAVQKFCFDRGLQVHHRHNQFWIYKP